MAGDASVAELVGTLVGIDSVNPDLVPGGAGEAEIASFVAGWLRDAGLDDTPWMDAALTQAAGIPTVVVGPGGEGAHAVVEWVLLDDVATCAEVLHAMARDFCA